MYSFNFRKLISDNTTATFRFGLIVFIGLAIETAVEVYFRKDASCIEITLRLIANILIAGGVLGEVIFAHRVSKEADEQQRKSDEKIAEANARAAAAELRTEQIKVAFAWRRLSSDAIRLISETLSKFPKMSVRITFVGVDPETNTFAHELGSVFSKNEWKVAYTSATYSGEVAFGLIIAQPYTQENVDATAVARMAATNAGIEFLGGFIPQWFLGAGSGETIDENIAAQIYVGPKNMPKLD